MKTTPGNSLLPFLTCESISALPTPQGVLSTKRPMRLARKFSSKTLHYRVLRETDGGPRVLYSRQSLFRLKTTDRISQLIIHLSQFSLLCQDTDWGAYQQQNYFLTVPEAGSPRSSAAQRGPGEGPRPRSYLSSHTGRGEGAFWGPIYEDTDAILEGSTLMASQSPTSTHHHVESRISTDEFGGNTSIQSFHHSCTCPRRTTSKSALV